MADTLYAWSPFKTVDKDGAIKVIPVGEKVSQSDVADGDDDTWAYLQEAGAVRPVKYPDDVPSTLSPREHAVAKAAEAFALAQAEVANVSGSGGMFEVGALPTEDTTPDGTKEATPAKEAPAAS